VISVSEDASLRVWNPKNGEAFHKISGCFMKIFSGLFSFNRKDMDFILKL